jgi:hypothetical protein
MRIHEWLGLRIVQKDGEAIVMVPAVRVVGEAELPIYVGHAQLLHDGLPAAQHGHAGLVGGGRLVEVLEAFGGHYPAVFLVYDGLGGGGRRRRVVSDPLRRPRHRLGPLVRVRVENSKVDGGEAQLARKVAPVAARVRPVVRPARR